MARTYRKKRYKEKDKTSKLQRKLFNKKERTKSKTEEMIQQYEDEKHFLEEGERE